jgi:hypothetical protein
LEERALSFDMSISRKEFLRLLPGALGGDCFAESGGDFLHAEPGRSWHITLSPLTDLELGSMRLERHRVEWRFSGYADAEIETILQRFELHFRRGGG